MRPRVAHLGCIACLGLRLGEGSGAALAIGVVQGAVACHSGMLTFAEAGVAAGADGVHIEVHDCPEKAKSDGPQALLPRQYAELAEQIRKLAALFGKTISTLPGTKA